MIFNENLNRETMPPPAISSNFPLIPQFIEKKSAFAEVIRKISREHLPLLSKIK